MKSSLHRSADYAGNMQTMITSAKLLQDATESTTEPGPSGALLEVAIDRLEMIKALKTNQDIGEELAEKISHQVSTMFHEMSRPTANEDIDRLIRKSVTRYTAALMGVQDALTRFTQRGKLGTSLMRGRDRRELQGLTAGIDTEFNSFMKTIGKQSSRSEFRRSLHATASDFSASAPVPGSARATSPSPSRHASTNGQHIRCWPGTRVPFLDEINHWATANAAQYGNSTSANSPIYWLADIPGSGKSVIAADLADEWREKGILGGYYDAGTHTSTQRDNNRLDPICQAWAEQLASAFPEMTTSILQALSEVHRTPSVSRGFQQQLKLLIMQPLKQLRRDKHGLGPQAKVIFVLDSLDEYSSELRIAILQGIKLIGVTQGIKFLLVSRLPTTDQDVDIMEELLEAPPTLVTRGSINIHSASNMADILLYLTAQFQIHSHQFQNHPQFRSTLIEPTIRVLAKRSEGLILWTKMAFEMLLAAENPTKMLLNLLEEDSLADINGLYLELVLQAQTRLDRITDDLAVGKKKIVEESDTSKDHNSTNFIPFPQPSSPSPHSPLLPDSYPRNSLAIVLSAIGYAKEPLSVLTIAELTGLGLERTMAVLHLLTIVIDYGQPSMVPQSPPAPPPEQRPRSGSKLNSPSSFYSRKRSQSNTRTSSFSPSRRKISGPDAPRPVSAPFPPVDRKQGSSVRSGSREKRTSIDLPHFAAPSPSFQSLSAATDFARTASVKTRHSTFGEWIRLAHPPTLLSCLTGRTAMEEDDLRFVVAPTRDGGQAMLAKGCLAIIRKNASITETGGESPDGRGSSSHGEDGDTEKDDVAYACRYWPLHCAQLLEALNSSGFGMYMSSGSSGGSRWKDLRGDMLEFFTRRLLWWVDVMSAEGWAEEGVRGLNSLREVLQGLSVEEDLRPVVSQLVQWTLESARLLEKPLEILSIPESERNPDSSLVWRYYGDELTQRAVLFEARAQQANSSNVGDLDDNEPLTPPPPLFDTAMSVSSRSQSNRASTPKLVPSSVASMGSEKAASTFASVAVASEREGANPVNDEKFVKFLVREVESQNQVNEPGPLNDVGRTPVKSAATAQMDDEKSLPPLPDPSVKSAQAILIPSAKPVPVSPSAEMPFGSPLFPSLTMFGSKFTQAMPEFTRDENQVTVTMDSIDQTRLQSPVMDSTTKDQIHASAESDERTELEEVHEGNNAHVDHTQVVQILEVHTNPELASDETKESSNVPSISRAEEAEEKPLPQPSSLGEGSTITEDEGISTEPSSMSAQLIDDPLPSAHEGVNFQTPEPTQETQPLSEEPHPAVPIADEDSVSSEHEVPPAVPSKEDKDLPTPLHNRPQKPFATLAPTTSSELVTNRSEPVVDQPPKSTPISPVKGKEKSLMSFKKVQKSLLHRKSKDATATPQKETEPIPSSSGTAKPLSNSSPAETKLTPIVIPDPIVRNSAPIASSSSPPVPKELGSSPSPVQPLKPVGNTVKPQGVKTDPATPAVDTATKPEATTAPKPLAKNESPAAHKTRYQPTTRPNAAFDSPISKNISPLFPSLSLFSSTSYGQPMKSPGPRAVAFSTSGRTPKADASTTSVTDASKFQNRGLPPTTTPEESTQPVFDRTVAPHTTSVDNSTSLGPDSAVADMVEFINFDNIGLSFASEPRR